METIIGYRFHIYYDSSLIHQDDDVYESESEARAAAEDYITDRIEQYKSDNAWGTDDSRDFFDVVIDDVTEEV